MNVMYGGAMILAFANAKGGCGKTTATVHCAQVLADGGRRVGIMDLDRQATARRWIETSAHTDRPLGATEVAVVGHAKSAVPAALAGAAERYDDVLIDAAPGGWVDLSYALHTAPAGRPLVDAVVVPCRPMPFDWVQYVALRDELAADPVTARIAVFGLLTQARVTMSNYADAAARMAATDERTGRPFGLVTSIPLREGELARIQFVEAPAPDTDLYRAHGRVLAELEQLMEAAA